MKLWHRLSGTLDLFGVERLLAKNQVEMKTEYKFFVQWLFEFVNQEITQFVHKLT